jgi:glycosyltransferase involved in cell wall biosynthesis
MDVALKRSGIRALVRDLVCRNIDGVIFNSDEVASWHIKNISSSLPHLTLPIVHKDSVLRTSFKESITTANYNIDARYLYGKQVILFTGRLEKVKNVDFLLKCFFKLKKDNLVLVLVGSGEQRSHLESLTKNNSNTANVIFTGRLEGEDLLSWYLIADLFVLPSTYEPYGAVVNEALIAGCNVLCSKYAGASSLITKNNGAIFDPFSERDLIEKMTYYLNHSQPITNKIEELRDNKMPFSFNERIDSLISAIG